jgi:riboflavin kinase/FMN adenylyltransferase
MQILSNLFEIKLSKSTIATIGTFDGIHIGHQKILNSLARFAKENSLKQVVITFDPHPRKIINKKNSIELINTIEEKKEKLKTLGIDYLIVQKFDEKFSETEANKFVEILKNNINIEKLIVGYDHRFGKNRNADINDLKKYGKELNFEVIEIDALEIEEVNISSTKIRSAIKDGNIRLSNSYLGYNFFLSGEVVKGHSRGKELGFPTANLKIDEDKIIPKNGVYLVKSKIDHQDIYGMMNIGYNPTFNNKSKKIETHFFNLNKNLYGKIIKIELLEYIREEKRFETVGDLIQRLKLDREKCLKLIH